LGKLDAGEYDAIVLATSGLQRLELSERIRHEITAEQCLPAVTQGTLGIEYFAKDTDVLDIIKVLNHTDTEIRTRTERAMNHHLEGGCQVPIGAYAELVGDDQIHMRGLVGSVDGSTVITAEATGSRSDPEALGIAVAKDLLAQGAGEILKEVYEQS